MIVPMERLEIVCLKESLPELLAFLHDAGVLHVEAFGEIPENLEGKSARMRLTEEDDRIVGLLSSVVREGEEILQAAGPPAGAPPVVESLADEELEARFRAHAGALERLRTRRAALRQELDLLPHYERIVEAFFSAKSAFERKEDQAMMGLVLERRPEREMRALEEDIQRAARGHVDIAMASLDADRVVAVVAYDRRFEKELEGTVWSQGVDRLDLPDDYIGKPLETVLAQCARRRRELPGEVAEADDAYRQALARVAPEVAALVRAAAERVERVRIRTAFLQSERTVAIEGYVPAGRAQLFADLEARFGPQVAYVRRPPRAEEHPPVALENAAAARPYELLLSPLSPPRYGGLDPTPWLALFFPVFFGLMVGDMGHGAVIVLGALALWRVTRPGATGRLARIPRAVPRILLAMGGWSIVFGLCFGELFGSLGEGLVAPLWFSRTKNLMSLLVLAVSLGAAHVALGLALGLIQAVRLGKRRHAAVKALTLGALVLGLVAVASLSRLLPPSLLTPGVALLIALVPVLIWAGGFLALVELLSTAGHVLSYARLMALGLAGAMLAEVANTFATGMGSVVVGTLLALLLHLLNLVMSLFSPTIQALRLNYVEFLSEFYEPGGAPYAPFSRKARSLPWKPSDTPSAPPWPSASPASPRATPSPASARQAWAPSPSGPTRSPRRSS